MIALSSCRTDGTEEQTRGRTDRGIDTKDEQRHFLLIACKPGKELKNQASTQASKHGVYSLVLGGRIDINKRIRGSGALFGIWFGDLAGWNGMGWDDGR